MTASENLYPISSKTMIDPPCDACETRRMCGLLQMACYEYAQYVHRVTDTIRRLYRHDARIPNVDIYERIHRDQKSNRKAVHK